MYSCVFKVLGFFETSQNSDLATQCHISEDPNPQSVRCGKLKSLKSRQFRKASECRLMVGHGAERRAEHRVLPIIIIAIILSPEHYADLYMFSRGAAWVMMGINQGVKITTERHGDSCVFR